MTHTSLKEVTHILHVRDVVLQVLPNPRELCAVRASNRDRVDLAEPPQLEET